MIAVYKITNTITGDYYIGSSKDVKRRWSSHRWQSRWKQYPNNQLYIDMQKYGKDKFVMEVIEELPDADTKMLHNREQYYIEKLQPVYNIKVADTGIEANNKQEYNQQYYSKHSDELKQRMKQYYSQHADDKKQYQKQYYSQYSDELKQRQKQYNSQQCNYNGEILTLRALGLRFIRQGIEHPVLEAKKYLIEKFAS